MVGAFNSITHEGVNFIIALHRFTGLDLRSPIGIHGLLRNNFAGQSYAGAETLDVIRML